MDGGGGHVLNKVAEARSAGDEQNAVVVGQEPCQTYLSGRDADSVAVATTVGCSVTLAMPGNAEPSGK